MRFTLSGMCYHTFTYDAAGNITAIRVGGVLKLSYEYDNLNQLTRENNAYTSKTYVYTFGMVLGAMGVAEVVVGAVIKAAIFAGTVAGSLTPATTLPAQNEEMSIDDYGEVSIAASQSAHTVILSLLSVRSFGIGLDFLIVSPSFG